MDCCVAFVGPTGIGKTFNTYYELTEKGHRVLLCRSLEDLKDLDLTFHTDILFDDISFENRKPELLITLTDKDFHCSVRILQKSVAIPPNINKWFTHNDVDAFKPVLASWRQQEAINRRLSVVQVECRQEILSHLQASLTTTSSMLRTPSRSSAQSPPPPVRQSSRWVSSVIF